MKLKLTNKKRAIQIGAFGVILIFVLGLVLNSNFSQAKAEMVNVNVDGTIKILEVGPGNLSRLADGIGTYTKTSNGKNYTVTYMSMPEYISGIDDVAGKYDIVAITNKNDNLADKFTNANIKETKYTKYSTAFQEKMSRLRYAAGTDGYGKFNYGDSLSQKNYYFNKDFNYKEYYSENDITDKRANSILDMANRGQVVYVENSALIDGSKLKEKFGSASNVKKADEVKIDDLLNEYDKSSKKPEVSNFKVSADDSNLTVGQKSTRSLAFSFDYDNAPENFVVKVYVDYNADGMFKEYQSGSGYRNELLVAKTFNKNTIGNNYEIQTSIDSSFIGYLDWKVEVYAGDETKVKTSVTSSFKFKKLTADKSGAVELNVLQVYPDTMSMFNENGDYTGEGNYKDVGGLVLSNKAELKGYNDGTQGVFNNGDGTITIKQKSSKDKLYIAGTFNSWAKQEMSKNTSGIYEIKLNLSEVGGSEYKIFEEPNNWYSNSGNVHVKGNDKNSYIYTEEEYKSASINEQSKKFQKFLNAVDDYSITVDSIPVTEFNTNCNDASKKTKMQDYDMIIIGFGDSYGAKYDFNENATKVVQSYIDSKALMLSHDTISLNINEPLTTEGNGSNAKGTTFFTNELKSQVGQSRYENDTINVNGTTYTSYGQTLYAVRDWSEKPTKEGENFYEQSKTKTVREVSQAQITEYPYNLSDTGISTGTSVDGQNAINISQTHTQWYQLDLENEDISPWFNLVADGSLSGVPADQFNSGDARNFYYTYSIGNITYSGTGHTSNYTDPELKLFVNTIIRAARSSKTSNLNFVTTTDSSIDMANPTKVNITNKDFVVNFTTTGTIKETVSKNSRTTIKETPFNGEVINSYVAVVYDKAGNIVDVATSLGSGETSGLNPKYTIPVATLELLSQNGYILAITPNVVPKNTNSYDSVTSSTCTAYIIAEAPEVLSVKHGMIDGAANGNGISNLKTGCEEVEYYTSIPFEAQISGMKLYTNKTIELSIDKNFLLDEGFAPKVYSVSNAGLTEVAVNSNIEEQKDGTTKVTIELGELQASEIIVRYEAKTMAQPEQTTNVDENGMNISVDENVVYQNNIEVTSETSKSASASVQVGRVVLDRPLF